MSKADVDDLKATLNPKLDAILAAVGQVSNKTDALRAAAFDSLRVSEVELGIRPAAPDDSEPLVKASAAGQWKYSLEHGEQLVPRDTIWSPNGRNKLTFQTDGNVVLYGGPFGDALWSTQTWGKASTKFVLQDDGNLVDYAGDSSLWNAGTRDKGGVKLVVQNDNNLVLYNATGAPVWSSNTRS